ncbi:GspH/FimT family pseudopilin [Vreelandella populi]|uniref:Type II secretion system protein H n=1 Tax=Vreelandella populi TaxID=2498858 RepID=A0A433L8Y1_9GAMM|nr:GspH/FimT family pseudopilin [Halomonas populi]RUR40154.1 prepilin-type N-terminal cleavage/methylation domain-containing protein [Halomonas populi]RUR43942.1 prepilin-type N-terminal cleavage/methylation domain-containing protein [Halomonas populi]RUR56595.1 prepilin-type N-terminal cleavage/methylation domain-containing protein [Halomonas populi]
MPYPSIVRCPAPGFTLLELLVVLVLIGVLAAWGVPSFNALGERTAITSEINRLQSALSLARSTAITHRAPITLCPANRDRTACANDWSGELMLVSADKLRGIEQSEVVRVFPATAGVSVAKNGHDRIRYTPLGHATGFNSTFSICPARHQADAQGASLVLSTLGRARVEEAQSGC